MKQAQFFRKAMNLKELKDWTKKYKGGSMYRIEKIIELTDEEYNIFSNDLLEDAKIIIENKELMFEKFGTWHCILIKPESRNEGILAQASGYDYPRYSAYLENIEE